jgi:uncharacterized oxidoreductase
MPTCDPASLRDAISAVYRAKGATEQEAEVVARHQVAANLVGHDSHGVITTLQYVRQIDKGEIVLGAELGVEDESATTAVLTGNWGFGFVMTEQAIRLGIEKARATGTAGIVIRHQGHIGRLGAYAAMAAEHDMIALITADSGRGPKAVAPFGGRSRRLGTNPICFGVPSDLPGPVVLDMATSAVAVGKLALAQARGEAVPDGSVVDKEGRVSTDPGAFFEGGALLPLGGAHGYKGFGLSFMVEILCGLLTGLGYGVAADGRHNDGNFIGLFDVGRFREVDTFKRDVGEFVEYLRDTPPAQGFERVLYPGELEHLTEQKRSRTGIAIEDETWDDLVTLMAGLGVSPPPVREQQKVTR